MHPWEVRSDSLIIIGQVKVDIGRVNIHMEQLVHMNYSVEVWGKRKVFLMFLWAIFPRTLSHANIQKKGRLKTFQGCRLDLGPQFF